MTVFRLTSNVFVQDALQDPSGVEATHWSEIVGEPAANVMRISHIVNWFNGDQLAVATQTETARTMMAAARATPGPDSPGTYLQMLTHATLQKVQPGTPEVRLVGCTLDDEMTAAPSGFQSARPLKRSVLDVGSFNVPRRLPLLFDILESGAETSDTEGFLVYTNSDICLQPHFYASLRALLSQGLDCLIINRRTVKPLATYGANPELAMMDSGHRHPGLDCFVFPVAWEREFVRSNACVGAGYVMRSLLYNLVAKSRKMLIMRDVQLTYHFGDNQEWADKRLSDYVAFNLEQARLVLTELCRQEQNRTVLSAFCQEHREPLRPGVA